MRSLGIAFVLCSLAGCTGQPPTAEELEIAEDEARVGAEVVSIPADRATPSPPPPAPEPELEPVELHPAGGPRVDFSPGEKCDADDLDADDYDDECPEGIAGCGFTISAVGFPGISRDGTQVVTLELQSWQGADVDISSYDVVWRTVEDDQVLRTVRLVDGSEIFEGNERGGEVDLCDQAAKATATAVASVDAELRDGWRPLTQLAVQVPRSQAEWMAEEDEDLEAAEVPRPPKERPVEAFYRSGFFYLRVKGIKVLHEEVRTDWLGERSDMSFDSYLPNIRSLWGDASTGVTVVEMDYESGSCLSDSDPVFRVVQLSPAAFVEIESRAHNVRDTTAEPE